MAIPSVGLLVTTRNNGGCDDLLYLLFCVVVCANEMFLVLFTGETDNDNRNRSLVWTEWRADKQSVSKFDLSTSEAVVIVSERCQRRNETDEVLSRDLRLLIYQVFVNSNIIV